MCSFPNLESVCCSMSSSNCCFLTCIQISQEVGKVSDIPISLKNFPQFIVIHRVKGFSVVNEAEVDIFLKFSCFFYDPMALLMSAPESRNGSWLRTRKYQFALGRHQAGISQTQAVTAKLIGRDLETCAVILPEMWKAPAWCLVQYPMLCIFFCSTLGGKY